jgi:uncharacterized protein (TIGR03437 family)
MTKHGSFVFLALVPALLAAAPASLPGRLPLTFEPNVGQSPATVPFLARGNGYSLALTPDSVLFLAEGKPVRMSLHGANPKAAGKGELPRASTSNYFRGADARQWKSGVPHFGRVRFREVYPGVDLVYYGNPAELEYDFVVAPGADWSQIAFSLDGAKPRLGEDGSLILTTAAGEVRQPRPVLYQEKDSRRIAVAGGYRLLEGERIGFYVDGYDSRLALTIDPVLQFSTFYGGRIRESANAIALDAAGNVYVAGVATSPDFPISVGAYQRVVAGGNDIFVAKLNATGTEIIYSTLVGGSSEESGAFLAVDNAGNAYVSGTTRSGNFPTTAGAYRESQNTAAGDTDGFIFKLNATGTDLIYSTRLGGRGTDNVYGIAVDSSLAAYVTGDTDSSDFPVTQDAWQTERKGSNDAFVTKINPSGTGLIWSTLLGGDSDSFIVGFESGRAIAVDRVGQVYVGGITTLRDFPTTANAPQRDHLGQGDGFFTKLNSTGTQILFSTLLGGEANDTVNAMGIDGNGTNIVVVGTTASARFPVTPQVLQPFTSGGTPQPNEGFVCRFNASGQLIYSTFFGGRGDDQINGVVVDIDGAAYIIGTSTSPDLPTTFDAIQKNISGGVTGEPYDAFIAYLDPLGQSVPFATYLGGPRNDEGRAIARDAQGNIFVAGYTQSSGFPLTPGALQRTTGFGTNTAFIARIGETRLVPARLVIISGNGQSAEEGRPFGSPLVVELRDAFNNPVGNTLLDVAATNAAITGPVVRTGADGRATILATAAGRPGTATVTVRFGELAPAVFTLTVRRVGPPIPEIAPSGIFSYGESNPPVTQLAPIGLGVITGQAFTQPGNDREVTEADLVNGQWPTNFLGTCVTVGGIAVRLRYVAPHRIEFQVPEQIGAGTQSVVVIANCGVQGELRSEPVNVEVRAASPEFLYWTRNPDGRNPIRAINADTGREVTPQQPANPGNRLRLFGTGFGQTSPGLGAGEFPQEGMSVANPVTVIFDGRELPPENVVAAAALPGYPGLYYLDIVIPADTRNGNLPLVVRIANQTSPAAAYIRVAGGFDLEPRITVAPVRLDFGEIVIGQSRSLPITIANSGAFRLSVNAFDTGRANYTIAPSGAFTLEPGEARVLSVTVTTAAVGAIPSNLVIASSDPVTPLLTVPMTATGIVQPPPPNPLPVITSLQPQSIVAGGAPFSLIVNGRDFTRLSTVEVNGEARPTFFNFNNQLIATVRAQDILQPGELRITVFTPAPGGGRSQALPFTVVAAPQLNQPLALINQLDLRFCPQITSYVTVLDGNGNPVRNLGSGGLTCREDNEPVACTIVPGAAEAPLSVTIVYGVNGVTSEEDLLFLRNAVRSFITSLQPNDRVAIVHLEQDARPQLDFTEDKERALAVIETLRPAGNGNALYDAVNYAAVQTSRQTARRQAVVLFTAIDNLSGTFGLEQSLGIARGLGVPFYTIGVAQAGTNVNLTGYLRQLARDTHGQFFTENRPLSYGGLFGRLQTTLQSQYAVTHSAPVFDGRSRTLSMTFAIPEGTVTATRVYTPCAP